MGRQGSARLNLKKYSIKPFYIQVTHLAGVLSSKLVSDIGVQLLIEGLQTLQDLTS